MINVHTNERFAWKRKSDVYCYVEAFRMRTIIQLMWKKLCDFFLFFCFLLASIGWGDIEEFHDESTCEWMFYLLNVFHSHLLANSNDGHRDDWCCSLVDVPQSIRTWREFNETTFSSLTKLCSDIWRTEHSLAFAWLNRTNREGSHWRCYVFDAQTNDNWIYIMKKSPTRRTKRQYPKLLEPISSTEHWWNVHKPLL